MSLSEGPTSGGVEQYEVMEVDEEASGGDGPGPQRCKLLFSLVSSDSFSCSSASFSSSCMSFSAFLAT